MYPTNSHDLAKQLLPSIYNGLMVELREYYTKRSHLSELERKIYDVALTASRCNLCSRLWDSLNTREIGCFNQYNPSEMREIGTDKVLDTYKSIYNLLNVAKSENQKLTDINKAGRGDLQDILTKYNLKIDPLISQLIQHDVEKGLLKTLTSYGQVAADTAKMVVSPWKPLSSLHQG